MLYGLMIALVVLFDQMLKLWIVDNFTLFETKPLLPGFLELKYVQNTGGGWSILSEHTWLLSIFTAIIIVVVAYLLLRKIVRHPVGVTGCSLVMAGGLGNLIDRLRMGYVVDMFNFQFMNYPVFNIADIAIVCGMILAVFYYLFLYEKTDGKKEDIHDTADEQP